MMGRDHSLSGALVGTAVATLATISGHPLTFAGTATLIAVTAGFALWPDIDHPSATAARSFGPLTGGLAQLLDSLGEAVHRATSSTRDKPTRDGHRTITHTLAFAVLSGLGAFAATAAWPRWGTFAVLFVGLSFALRGLVGGWARKNGWLALSAVAAAFSGAAMVIEPAAVAPELLGFAVALGSFTHCLGDSCTIAGCPWLWPIPIRGQLWYPIGTPQFLRFRTGTEEVDGEEYLRALMWIGLVLLIPAQIPGAYPWLFGRVSELLS